MQAADAGSIFPPNGTAGGEGSVISAAGTNCGQISRREILGATGLAGGGIPGRSNSVLTPRATHAPFSRGGKSGARVCLKAEFFRHTSRFFSAAATASAFEWTWSFPYMLLMCERTVSMLMKQESAIIL